MTYVVAAPLKYVHLLRSQYFPCDHLVCDGAVELFNLEKNFPEVVLEKKRELKPVEGSEKEMFAFSTNCNFICERVTK